jgi:hypothetical protein
MRRLSLLSSIVLVLGLSAADVESRVLTRYVPQDTLEAAVRTEGWTEIPLDVKGGVRKGDTIRVWAGGSIDRGDGDKPGDHVNGPEGSAAKPIGGVLSSAAAHSHALLVKTEEGPLHAALPAGKPLEIKASKDKERLWLGFNDQKDRYHDNHIGKGRRHELDPLWVRIEVVRTVVD